MKPRLCLRFFIASVALAAAARAQIVEDFSQGHGDDPGGAYVGRAGGGWTTPWMLKRVLPVSTVDRDVTDLNPLVPGGGNYLSVSGVATKPGIWGISRQFAPVPSRVYNGIRRDANHTIRFDLRIDELGGWSRGEEITIGDSFTTAQYDGVGQATSFFIRAYQGGDGNARPDSWALFDGTRDGKFNSARYVDTGIPLVVGATYRFTIRLYPETRSWSATISDGTRTYTSGSLGYRAAGLGTGVFTIFRTTNQSTDSTTLSLDNIRIDDGA